MLVCDVCNRDKTSEEMAPSDVWQLKNAASFNWGSNGSSLLVSALSVTSLIGPPKRMLATCKKWGIARTWTSCASSKSDSLYAKAFNWHPDRRSKLRVEFQPSGIDPQNPYSRCNSDNSGSNKPSSIRATSAT